MTSSMTSPASTANASAACGTPTAVTCIGKWRGSRGRYVAGPPATPLLQTADDGPTRAGSPGGGTDVRRLPECAAADGPGMCVLLEWAPLEGNLASNYGPSPRRPQLLTDSPAAEFRSRRSRWRSRADWPRSGGWIGGSTGVVWAQAVKPTRPPGRRTVLFTPATARTRSAGGRARSVFSR